MKGEAGCKAAVLTGALLLAAGAAIPVRAQDPDDLKRGVARISLMEGEVSVRRGDSGEWVAGVINAPLLTDDRIATGQNSRAEIEFDAANVLRIGGNAEIHLALLENGRYQLEIARGTVSFRVLRPSNASVELNTPSVSVRPAHEGTFRLTVTEAGESEITARSGDVEVFTPKGTQWVYDGQTMMARGNPADPEFQITGAIPADDWDGWNDSRDRSEQSSNSYQYVPPGVYGAEDLDTSGVWTEVPPYGHVWRPTVAAGWAPYRNGRWVWLDWYGWTWVSYDSWGWAPYHYGRWFFDARWGWSWYPGALGTRHYWSPALVGFFGYGGGVGVGVGFGFGNVGWVPLAPYETFHPWWGRGYAGGLNRGISIANVNVTTLYRNARAVNGISGVAATDFTAGRFANVQRVSSSQVLQAGLVNGRMPLNPSAASRRFSDRPVTNIPRTSANTRFFSRNAGQGSAVMGATARTAVSTQGQTGYRRFGEPAGNAANTRPPQAATGTSVPNRQGTVQRFGEPSSSPSTPRNDRPPASQSGNSNWRSFGAPGSSSPAPRQPYNPPASRPAASAPAQQRSAPTSSAPRSAPSTGSHPSSGGGHTSSGGGGGKGHR
jgi:hypothetical protein